MRKRELCQNHTSYIKNKSCNISKDNPNCSICRWQERPITLKDFARDLEGIAENLRFAHDHPDYDPHGITFLGDFENVVVKFLNSIDKSYRKNMLESIVGKVRDETK